MADEVAPQGPQGRVKELIDEDMTRPRSDSTGSRTRAWSGSNFDSEGRPRSFTQEAAERRVVVMAVDASEAAAQAFDWFARVVHKPDIYLLLLHVPELNTAALASEGNIHSFRPGDVSFSPSVWQESWQKEKGNISAVKVDYEKKMADKGIAGKWLTLNTSRKPGEALVKAAHEYKATFMVVGSRGLGTIRRTFMGSVSDYVVHHAKIPVLVCKQKKK